MKRAPLWLGLVVAPALAAWVGYARMLGAFFRNDDFAWLGTAQAWLDGTRSLLWGEAGVTPFYNLLYLAVYRTFGASAWAYYAMAILLHSIASVLVAWLVWRLILSAAPAVRPPAQVGLWAAASAGVFFALLFAHQEAVAWSQSAHHVLAAVLVVGATLLWMSYREGRRWALPLSVLLAVLATLSKESGLVVLPLVVVVDRLLYRDKPAVPVAWQAVPVLVHIGWRLVVSVHHDSTHYGSMDYQPGWRMVPNLLLVPPQMLLPDLRFDTFAALLQRVLPESVAALLGQASLAPLLALSVLAGYGLARGRALVRLGLLWSVLGFLPFLPFVYFYARAPRYGYLPSVGLALLVGLLVQWALTPRPRGRARTLALAAVGLYVAGSFVLLQVMASNRLRDSVVRRVVLAEVRSHLPAPPPDAHIQIQGLPTQFRDLEMAMRLFHPAGVVYAIGDDPPPEPCYHFVFSASPPRLLSFAAPRAAGGRSP
ncbi:MAG: hypothetical protein KKI08_25430 [Armatimonadetes bacterium]|nr:hypothetical protein [Armatimonadota bacterium]